jgi:hypothetical protein
MEEQNTTGESIESVSFKSIFFKKHFRTSIKYFFIDVISNGLSSGHEEKKTPCCSVKLV